MENPLVSILVPVYNREQFVSATLDSALSQTYENIEVVVVDNASTDGTWSIIQDYNKKDVRIRAFRNDKNVGPVRNWQRCAEEAQGEIGKILWSDDLIASDFLEKTVPLLDDETAFVYSSAKVFTNQPSSGKLYYAHGSTGHYPTEFYIREAVLGSRVPVSPGCAIFHMKDLRCNLLVDIENKVDSDFSMHAIGNDLLIYLLTANTYKKFGFVSESLSFFRAHEGSISVSSKNGKLPLHYSLAKAFFVENYRPDLSEKLAARVLLLLIKYRRGAKEFNLSSVSSFFFRPCSVDYIYLCRLVLNKIFPRKYSSISVSRI